MSSARANSVLADSRAPLAAHATLDGAQVHRVWTARFGRERLFGRALDYFSFFITSTAAMMRRTRRGDIIVAMTDPPLISICAAAVAKLRGALLINWLQDVFPEVATALGVAIPAWLARMLCAARDWSLRGAGEEHRPGPSYATLCERPGRAGEQAAGDRKLGGWRCISAASQRLGQCCAPQSWR